MENQPVLSLPKTTLERRLEIIAYLLVGLHFLLVAYYYSSLPEHIPVRVSSAGTRMADKIAIFQLPIIGLVLCLVLTFLAKFPHKLKYHRVITTENAAFEYSRTRRILLIVNTLNSILFLLIGIVTIRASFGSGSLSDALWIVISMLVITPWLVLRR